MDDIKAFFRSEWAATAPAWARWTQAFREQTGSATELVMELAQLRRGMHVLDLASGTGAPALEIAASVGTEGRVIASDLVPAALQLCAAEARSRGFSQLDTCEADIEALPFEAASFDAVTCRLGIMFCPDIDRALAEVKRVLKASGNASFVVWGDPAQPLFASTFGEIHGDAWTEAPGDRPGPFRFAPPGRLTARLQRAGFRGVREVSRAVRWPWPGNAEQMWSAWVELSGPSFAEELAAAVQDRPGLNAQIIENLRRYERAGRVELQAQLVGVQAQA